MIESKERPYLVNVWRLLFCCTPGPRGWTPLDASTASLYGRIFDWGIDINRDLDEDLTSAQISVEKGLKFDDWIEGALRHEHVSV